MIRINIRATLMRKMENRFYTLGSIALCGSGLAFYMRSFS